MEKFVPTFLNSLIFPKKMNTEQPTEKLEELGNSSRSTFENYWPFAFIFFLLVIVHLIKSFLCWIILYRRKKNQIESIVKKEIVINNQKKTEENKSQVNYNISNEKDNEGGKSEKNNIEKEKVGPADSIEQDENVGI